MTDGSSASARPHAAMTGHSIPLVDLIDALNALAHDPDSGRLNGVKAALDRFLETARATGAYLEIDAQPLPRLEFGVGSLSDRAAIHDHPSVVRADLIAGTDRRRLGVLWLEGPAASGESAAHVIALALDSSWSRAQMARTSERSAALDAATRGIASVQAIGTVLELIVERVRILVGARYAALGIVDGLGVIEKFVTVGINPEDREKIGDLPRGHGLLGLIIREGRTYRIPEIAAHPDSSGFPPHHPPMHSFLGVPVMVKGASVGNLYLTDKVGALEFSEEDEALAEMFALHAGIAIENAWLHEQVQRLVIVEERERIAKDLHDGVIQNIYAVGLSLEDLPELMDEDRDEARARVDRAIDALHVTIRDIRNFIMGLRPELLDDHDLVGSLQALADETRLNSMVEVETAIDPAAASALPEDARAPIFHMTREALSNVARHSHATRASVVLRIDRGSVRLEIDDNGVGFDPDEERLATHQGLANMAARAARHRGRLAIESAVGTGTRIIVTVDRANGSSDRSPSTEPLEQEAR